MNYTLYDTAGVKKARLNETAAKALMSDRYGRWRKVHNGKTAELVFEFTADQELQAPGLGEMCLWRGDMIISQ